MKKIWLVLLLLLIPTLVFSVQPRIKKSSDNSHKNCVNNLVITEDKPSRPYNIISPLSVKANFFFTNSYDKLFPALKKKACKLNADAIIQYKCYQVNESDGHIIANNDKASGWGSSDSVAVCEGVAVKWQ